MHVSSTLHPEKLASKKFGYLACDRLISYIYFSYLEFLPL